MSGHEFAQLIGHDSSTIQAGDRYANNYISSSGPVVLLNNEAQTFEQVQQLTQQLQDLQRLLLPTTKAVIPLPSTDHLERAEGRGPSLKLGASTRTSAPFLHKLPELKQDTQVHEQEQEPITHPHFIVPYDINGRFIQRPEEFKTLSEIFYRHRDVKKNANPEPRRQPRAALYGLGGVGKTQIAIHFAHKYRHLYPDQSVFWIHASTEEWLRQSFLSIAGECGIDIESNVRADLYTAVGKWLKKSPRSWLMILDNADDADVLFCKRRRLADILAECPQGAILATTRNKRVAEKITKYGRSISVGQMSEGQCVDLMKSFLDLGYEHHSSQTVPELDMQYLSQALGYLPLALAQAAAYIRENSISPRAYLEMFNSSTENAQSLLDSEFEAEGRQYFDTEVSNAVGTTMMLSLDYLRQRKPRVGEALVFLSFLHPTNIQPSLLLKPEEKISSPSFIEALGDLQAFSLLQKSTDSSTYTMHRLVHHATCKWRTIRLSKEELQAATDTAVKRLVKCFETKRGKTDRGVADLLLPHAQQYLQEESFLDLSARVDLKVQLMRKVAEHLLYRGRISESTDLRCKILDFAQSHVSSNTIEVLRSKCELAEVFEQLHRFEKAQILCEEIVGALESTSDHRRTYINTLRTLSRILVKRGKFESALHNALAAKKVATEFLGESHEDALVLDFNVAEVMRYEASRKSAKRFQLYEAKDLLQGTVCRLTALKGENDSLTVLGKQHLVNVLEDLHELEASITISEDIIASKRCSLGEDHLETFQAKLGLALCFMKHARLLVAQGTILEALDHSSPAIDTHHLGRPKALQMLATIHERRAEQLKNHLHLGALSHEFQGQLPDTDLETADLITDFDKASLEEYQRALKLKMEVSECLQVSPGIEHPHTLQHMIDTSRTCMQLFLTNSYDFEDEIGVAESLQRRVLAVQRDLFGNKHRDTVTTKGLLMVTLHEKGSLDEADQLATEVYRYRVDKLGRFHRETLDMQQILAEIMYKQPNKRMAATKLVQKCYQSTLKTFGEDDADTQNRSAMWTTWRRETPVDELAATASASQSTWRMLDNYQDELVRPVAYNTVRNTAPISTPMSSRGTVTWRSSTSMSTIYETTNVVRGFGSSPRRG